LPIFFSSGVNLQEPVTLHTDFQMFVHKDHMFAKCEQEKIVNTGKFSDCAWVLTMPLAQTSLPIPSFLDVIGTGKEADSKILTFLKFYQPAFYFHRNTPENGFNHLF